jgi:hypothetical protein
MVDSNQVDFTVTSTPLPGGWLDQDVGIVLKAGVSGYSNGQFTMQTASAGLSTSSTQDAFHFVYQPLSGDGTIVARVLTTTNTYAQAGIMIRETMDPSAKTVFVETIELCINNAIDGRIGVQEAEHLCPDQKGAPIYWKTGAIELWRCWTRVTLSTKWGGAWGAMRVR